MARPRSTVALGATLFIMDAATAARAQITVNVFVPGNTLGGSETCLQTAANHT
jgi:hypothetical protein